jgi:hypothetical protein
MTRVAKCQYYFDLYQGEKQDWKSLIEKEEQVNGTEVTVLTKICQLLTS